jgi:hypothetical protein
MRIRVMILAALAAGLATQALAADAAKPPMNMAASGKGGDKALIASAESAAPPAIAAKATLVDMGPNGARVVRKGTNGFTCMADSPATPGPDPMCADENAWAWAGAWIGHKPPPAGKVGFMYMLAGGTDASNTDPYATKPSQANHWVKTGPHVMIVGDPEIVKHYPASPEPDTKQGYVMWAGTPYAHLMLPVK